MFSFACSTHTMQLDISMVIMAPDLRYNSRMHREWAPDAWIRPERASPRANRTGSAESANWPGWTRCWTANNFYTGLKNKANHATLSILTVTDGSEDPAWSDPKQPLRLFIIVYASQSWVFRGESGYFGGEPNHKDPTYEPDRWTDKTACYVWPKILGKPGNIAQKQ